MTYSWQVRGQDNPAPRMRGAGFHPASQAWGICLRCREPDQSYLDSLRLWIWRYFALPVSYHAFDQDHQFFSLAKSFFSPGKTFFSFLVSGSWFFSAASRIWKIILPARLSIDFKLSSWDLHSCSRDSCDFCRQCSRDSCDFCRQCSRDSCDFCRLAPMVCVACSDGLPWVTLALAWAEFEPSLSRFWAECDLLKPGSLISTACTRADLFLNVISLKVVASVSSDGSLCLSQWFTNGFVA